MKDDIINWGGRWKRERRDGKVPVGVVHRPENKAFPWVVIMHNEHYATCPDGRLCYGMDGPRDLVPLPPPAPKYRPFKDGAECFWAGGAYRPKGEGVSGVAAGVVTAYKMSNVMLAGGWTAVGYLFTYYERRESADGPWTPAGMPEDAA